MNNWIAWIDLILWMDSFDDWMDLMDGLDGWTARMNIGLHGQI